MTYKIFPASLLTTNIALETATTKQDQLNR